MKTYEVKRTVRGVEASVNGETLPNVAYRSKVGFGVGYDSAGAADLALSILVDYFGEKPDRKTLRKTEAFKLHQAFKNAFVVSADVHGFIISGHEIDVWLMNNLEATEVTI